MKFCKPARYLSFSVGCDYCQASPTTRLVDVVKIFDFSPFICVVEDTPTDSEPHTGDAEDINGFGKKDHDDRPLLGVITKIDLLKWLAMKQREA